ncbi:MAG: tetratricopeptide repeat protein, partial [Flavipsychrobacter sp.]
DTVKMALAAAYIEGAGETMQGVQLLLGIIREKPDNIPANLMLGRLAIQSGQFDKAVQRFETVLKQEPENTEAMYFLAEAYKGKGDKAKAIELFEKCKQLVNKPDFTKEIDQYINSFK